MTERGKRVTVNLEGRIRSANKMLIRMKEHNAPKVVTDRMKLEIQDLKYILRCVKRIEEQDRRSTNGKKTEQRGAGKTGRN